MKYGKTLMLSLAASAAVLMSGCGGGGASSDTTAAETPAAVLTVERGPLLDANVTDANGTQARELGEGKYAFDEMPQYPVTATGGYIDVNRNGRIDAGEVRNTLELRTDQGNVVTIATTLAADGNVSQLLQTEFGIDRQTVETKTPGESVEIEALSNTVYAYAVEHNLSKPADMNRTQLEMLKTQYHTMLQEYENDSESAAEHEEALMHRLEVSRLDDADAQQAQDAMEEKHSQSSAGGHTGGPSSAEADHNGTQEMEWNGRHVSDESVSSVMGTADSDWHDEKGEMPGSISSKGSA